MSDFKKYLNKYEFKTVLPGSGEKLTFKPITTGQMKALLVHEGEKELGVIELILDQLMQECIVTPKNFNVENMYINDRFFFLIELRKYTKGTTHQFEYKCTECASQSLQTVDLKNLNVTKLPKKVNHVVELNDDISVNIDFPRRIDQKNAYEVLRTYEGNPTESMQTAELGIIITALTINSVITPEGEDENISVEDKIYLLENITTELYEKIANWSTTNFGVDFFMNIKCNSCGYSHKVDIPPENFFF